MAADATGSTDVIVTSTANSDGGLFEANLRDERFLPFEGAGAIGTWTIGLPQQQNAFDLHTVTDVILHLRYTAIPPSGAAHAVAALDRYCLLDLRREFPDAWHRWKTSSAANAKLLVDLHRDRLPFTAGSSPTVLSYDVFVRASNIAASANVVARLGTEERALLVPGSAGEYGPLLYNVAPGGPIALGELAVEVGLGGNAFTSLRDRVGDLYLVCRYE